MDVSSASPPRNFTIPLAERIRGLHGPPAYSVRLREIEDIEARLEKRLGELFAKALRAGVDRAGARADALRRVSKKEHARLVDLVDRHNRYYPVEANLPMDPVRGMRTTPCGRVRFEEK